jgi:hypothetical protein
VTVKDPETVPCDTCGTPTAMFGTRRCNNCWEVESRLSGYLTRTGEAGRRFVIAALGDQNFGVGVPGLIAEECYKVRDLLHQKNAAYGNSALDPLRVFSKADSEEQIRVRIDDKLSRLARGSAAGEDVELDLLGYLILLRVARRLRASGQKICRVCGLGEDAYGHTSGNHVFFLRETP